MENLQSEDMKYADKLFNEVSALQSNLSSDGFELAIEGDYFKVYKKIMGDGLVAIRAYATFPDISPEDLAFILMDDAFRHSYDKTVHDAHSVKRLDVHTDIYYFKVVPPIFIVSNRDFLCQRITLKQYKGSHLFVYMKSIELPEMPPIKGTIRGKIEEQARLILPGPEGKGSILMVTNHMDLGGSIPHWAINSQAAKGSKMSFDMIKNNYPKWKKEGKIGSC